MNRPNLLSIHCHPLKAMSVPDGTTKDTEDTSLKSKLVKSGKSGLLAYGAVNLSYYTLATLLASNALKFDRGIHYATRAEKLQATLKYFGKLTAVVWLGSQATKLFRIGSAVFLSPVFARVLTTASERLRISRDRSFVVLVRGILATFFGFYVGYFIFLFGMLNAM